MMDQEWGSYFHDKCAGSAWPRIRSLRRLPNGTSFPGTIGVDCPRAGTGELLRSQAAEDAKGASIFLGGLISKEMCSERIDLCSRKETSVTGIHPERFPV